MLAADVQQELLEPGADRRERQRTCREQLPDQPGPSVVGADLEELPEPSGIEAPGALRLS